MKKKEISKVYYNDTEDMTLDRAKELFDRAYGEYTDTIAKYDKYYDLYIGKNREEHEKNLVYELIEYKIDNNLYYPQVRSLNGNMKNAFELEEILKNELYNYKYREFNDQQERNTYIFGQSITLVYWDKLSRDSNKAGKLEFKVIDPRNFIPQPGIPRLEQMDYCFTIETVTKLRVATLYDLSEDSINMLNGDNELSIDPNICTIKTMYYKDRYEHICKMVWSGDLILENDDDIYNDEVLVCKECGRQKDPDYEKCPECGNTTFKSKKLDRKKVEIEGPMMTTYDIDVLPYSPNKFPFVVRYNVSTAKFEGLSDVETLLPSQVISNRVLHKLTEKVLKSGSLIALPKTLRNKFKVDNSELKLLYYDNPAEAQGIQAINLQPSMGNETYILDMEYATAKDALGITNTFQGRSDTSALSSKAKQMQIDQTSGRLQSSLEMKKAATTRLFELMFQFILAYSDKLTGYYAYINGAPEYRVYDSRMFLQKEEKDKFFTYDDNYLFDIDASATYEADRSRMWDETRQNFASGVYGNPEDANTVLMFWRTMQRHSYPGAKEAVAYAETRVQMQLSQQNISNILEQQKASAEMSNAKMNILNSEAEAGARKTSAAKDLIKSLED